MKSQDSHARGGGLRRGFPRVGAAMLGGALLLGSALPASATEHAPPPAVDQAVSDETAAAGQRATEEAERAEAERQAAEEAAAQEAEGAAAEEAASEQPQPTADAAVGTQLAAAGTSAKDSAADGDSGDIRQAEPEQEGSDTEQKNDQQAEQDAVTPNTQPTAKAAVGGPADIAVTGIAPGEIRTVTDPVINVLVYTASVAGPPGVEFRIDAVGRQTSEWLKPGQQARMIFSEGGVFSGFIRVEVRNNGTEPANVYVDRGWERANIEKQLRVYASTNRSELRVWGDVLPLPLGREVTVNGTISGMNGEQRTFSVTSTSDGQRADYEHVARGLAPGTYTVHATVEVDGQVSRTVGGGTVIPLDDAPRLSLWFEPEVGPSEGYFNQIMQVRISVQDPDGIEWIRAKRNGNNYQTVANNSLQTFIDDGHHVLEVWARDTLGNETNPRTLEFNIDRTRPTIAISGALENGTVERGESATADFGCDDATSGVASCTISWGGGAPQPSGNAIDTSLVGTFAYTIIARDRAGNEMRRLGILTVDPGDITPPTVDHEVTPQPGATGWHHGEAEVILDAHDDDSGLASLQYRVDSGEWTDPPVLGEPVRVLVSGDGHHRVWWRASDAAGNSTGAQSVPVNIDATRPTIAVDPSLEDRQVPIGSVVNASFSCSDATSGVQSCVGSTPNGQPLPSDIAGLQTLSITATDVAGNTDTRYVSYRVVPEGEAVLDASATPDPQRPNGWWNGPVDIMLDPDPVTGASGVEWSLSGAQTGSGKTDGSESISVTQAGNTVLRYQAIDEYDRRGPVKTLEIRIDTTSPSASSILEPVPNARGWLRLDSNMRIESSDRDSGVSQLDFRVGSGPWQVSYPGFADVPITEEGEYAIEYRATDRAGNETALRRHAVRVDKTAPTVAIDPSIAGARVELGTPLNAAFGCDDDRSGVLSCQGMLPQGQPLPTDAVGTFEFWATAIDNAGNITREVARYTVVAPDPGGDPNGDPNGEPGGNTGGQPGGGSGSSGAVTGEGRGLAATGAPALGWLAGLGGVLAVAGTLLLAARTSRRRVPQG